MDLQSGLIMKKYSGQAISTEPRDRIISMSPLPSCIVVPTSVAEMGVVVAKSVLKT